MLWQTVSLCNSCKYISRGWLIPTAIYNPSSTPVDAIAITHSYCFPNSLRTMPHQVLTLMNHGMCSIPIKGCLIAMFNLFIERYRIGLSIMIQWWIHIKIVTNFSNNTGASIVGSLTFHICEIPVGKLT